MVELICRLAKDCRGPTAIEYGLITGVIALATIAALTTLGTTLNSNFNFLATKLGS